MAMKPGILLFMSAFLGAVAACGGDGDGGGAWGCDLIADSDACIEYSGSQWSGSERASYEAQCTDDGGTVVAECPADGVIGQCLTFEGTAAESTQFYYTGANVETAEQVCTTTGGSWSAG
jgi:hypothetical protein